MLMSTVKLINCGLKVTFNYDYIDKDTGLTQGTNDKAGQDAFNVQKTKVEKSRTEVYDGLKQIKWGEFQASSGLELKDKNVDNFNLGPVEAYCSEDGAVVKKCSEIDLQCNDPPCKCNKDTGSITKCSKYANTPIAMETRWPCGGWVRLLIERFGFEPWPGTHVLCCVVGQDISLSQCLFPPRCIRGTGELNAEGEPCEGLVSHPQGGGYSSFHPDVSGVPAN